MTSKYYARYNKRTGLLTKSKPITKEEWEALPSWKEKELYVTIDDEYAKERLGLETQHLPKINPTKSGVFKT